MDKVAETPGQAEQNDRLRVLAAVPFEEVAARAAATVVREIAAYGERDPEQVTTELLAVLRPVLAMLREDRDAAAEEQESFAAFGALRAEQGIGLEPLLEAFRLSTRLAFDTLYEQARSAAAPETGMELTRDFWAACDRLSTAMVRGYRERELADAQAAQEHRTLLLRQLLTGELPADWLPSAAATLGLDLRTEYRVCHARPAPGRDIADVERALRRHTTTVLAEPGMGRVIALTTRPLPTSFDLPAGIGEPRPLARLRESLAQAERADELAVAFDLDRCVANGELPLHSAVLTLPVVGEQLAERCFGHTDGARRATLVRTVAAYLAADANADQAAAALFVHPNTLRYRIRSLTTATGLDPARTEDALTLWWAVRHLEATAHGSRRVL
ncbi:helix-turn-helix domain-containing protein [Kitasatospora sp. NPDC005856]|uniref:helix-turn-helix domain-containing protein n=1 Tax=Kitasatospora sp. NPDC005856 TaxID=3154566 RepID=UPI0034115FF5